MENNSEVFSYEYSAKKQEEIQRIRDKYIPRSEDKMEHLKKLDETVTRKATLLSVCIGTISTLVLGLGMCCCMVWAGFLFVPGIVIGLAGMAGMALAYPLYNKILLKERTKIAPEVLRLSEELMK